MPPAGDPPQLPGRHRSWRWLQAGTGIALAVVVLVALVVSAHHGNAVAQVQQEPATVSQARLDDAYYRCIDVQARSLVSPDEPVTLSYANFAYFVDLLKGVGSWVTFADSPSHAAVVLSMRSASSGGCLGTVVVATYAHPHNGITVRTGSGASVPGAGPPPALPL